MRALPRLAASLVVIALASGGVQAAQADDGVGRQVGTYDYLVSPDYDGLVPVRQAAQGLTLGLGTFDRLDGELILVGGVVYRVGTDGIPREVADARTTPFFEGVRFNAAASGPVPPGTTCAQLADLAIRLAGTSTGMIAVRVRGTFADLVTRSVPEQSEPYPPLSAVVANQTVFPLGQRRAVLVGFLTSKDLLGVGAPGLHLHGVTADRTAGGHVLSCVAGPDVQLSVQPLSSVTILN